MKYNDNGTFKPIYVKALDSMPVGTEVDFDGQSSDIPVGWEQVEDKGEVYSTTEQRIGTWINNKPLYRRTFVINSMPNNETILYSAFEDTSIIDLAFIDYSSSYVLERIGTTSSLVGVFQSDVLTFSAIVDGKIFIKTTYDGSSRQAIVTVRYTKTTDQGGNA